MPEPKIEVESNKRLLRQLDFIVAGGEILQIHANDFTGEVHVEYVDEIPEEYYERYE